MLLIEFVELLDRIENESSTNKKIELIKPHITNPFLLSLLTMPAVNIGEKTIMKTLAKHTGFDLIDIQAEHILDGRLSNVVEIMLSSKKTTTLGRFFKIKGYEDESVRKDKITIIEVYSLLRKLSVVTGFSKQSALLHELFNMNNSAQVINIITGDRPLGIKENNIFKALPGKTSEVSEAYAICNNWFSLCSNIDDLSEIKPELFTPITAQLCQTQPLDDYTIKNPVAIDTKYDGVRIQVHYKNNKAEVYTRKLEIKTESMPDFVESITEWCQLNDINGIFDMELLPHNIRAGEFIRLDQEAVMTRFGKHGIHQKMKDVQLDARIFDVMILNDKILIDKTFTERRKIIEELKFTDKIKLTEMNIAKTTGEFKELFNEATDKHEGVVVKQLLSKYIPGNRGEWEKLKPLLPTFDFFITRAFHGKGKNAGMYSSFEVSALKTNGTLRGVGNVGIGFSEEEMKEITDEINSEPICKIPTLDFVEITNPKIIIEVACEKVNLIKGHISMDFARKVSIRTDKNEITTIEEMRKFVRKINE